MLDKHPPGTPPMAASDMHEAMRLGALERYDVLDASREAPFDRIAGLIRMVLDVPIAIVSVIDGHRQLYKGCDGLATDEAARKDTFCRHTILQETPLIVRDATKDPRFASNPYVLDEPHFRFYVGVPLRTSDGHNIGSVCTVGYQPREFTERETVILREFAELAMDELELRRHASRDALTGILSRRAFVEQGSRVFSLSRRQHVDLSCIMFDIDHFKAVNDTFGHAAGDMVLSSVAGQCAELLRDTDILGRLGGEEFAVLLPSGRNGAAEVAERLRASIEATDLVIGSAGLKVTASLGVASLDSSVLTLQELLDRADLAMYASKHAGRNRTTVWSSAEGGPGRSRRRVLKAGQIVFNDRMSTIDCTVRSLGEDGATIDVSSAAGIPERFVLVIRADGFEARCQIVSQAEKRLELRFA